MCYPVCGMMHIKEPLLQTESLAMPEAVPVSGRVQNLNVYGHVNKISHFPIGNNSPCGGSGFPLLLFE